MARESYEVLSFVPCLWFYVLWRSCGSWSFPLAPTARPGSGYPALQIMPQRLTVAPWMECTVMPDGLPDEV